MNNSNKNDILVNWELEKDMQSAGSEVEGIRGSTAKCK